MSQPRPDLHPTSVVYSLLLGLLATFIANLVPEPFNWIAIVGVFVALFAVTTIYLRNLPGKQHVPLVQYMRFLLAMFVLGAIIGALCAVLPTVIFDGITVPAWIAEPTGLGSHPQPFSLNEASYASAITLTAVVAYWVSRRLLRPLSVVLAAMAGAVIVDSIFTRSFLDANEVSSFVIDPMLTYLAWSSVSIGIVLLNAAIPIIVSELRNLFSPSYPVPVSVAPDSTGDLDAVEDAAKGP